MLRSELAIMKVLRHPNVIALKEVFDTKTHMYITMEFVEGGELFSFVMRQKRL
jgi:serine/threonine protein kinase